jgi:hypothetical protein
MIRILIVGYCFDIRSERRLCEEVLLNLAYRWFCRLGLDGRVPDHSTFSKNRHGRFRDSNAFRHVFETVVSRCIEEGLVGGEGFAVDASLIPADANKQRSSPAQSIPTGIASPPVDAPCASISTCLIKPHGARPARSCRRLSLDPIRDGPVSLHLLRRSVIAD